MALRSCSTLDLTLSLFASLLAAAHTDSGCQSRDLGYTRRYASLCVLPVAISLAKRSILLCFGALVMLDYTILLAIGQHSRDCLSYEIGPRSVPGRRDPVACLRRQPYVGALWVFLIWTS